MLCHMRHTSDCHAHLTLIGQFLRGVRVQREEAKGDKSILCSHGEARPDQEDEKVREAENQAQDCVEEKAVA